MRIDWKFMKKRKAIPLVLSLALIAGVSVAAGCKKKAPEHEHTFATEWTTDESGHWYGATCEHTDEKSGYAEHEYDNACDTTCNVCEAEREIEHAYDNACDTKCNVCDAEREIEHAYDNACDTKCNVCDAEREIEHDYKDTLTAGKTYHWYECEVCGVKKDEAEHEFTEEIASNDTLKAAATETTKAQYWKSCECGAISTTVYFETDKLPANLQVEDISKVYDGTPVSEPEILFDGVGGELFEYWQGDTKLSEKPTDAGTYKVIVTIFETETHAADRVEKDFTIAKRSVWAENVKFTYDGYDAFCGDEYPVFTLQNIVAGETIHPGDVTWFFDGKDVDSTLIDVKLIEKYNPNYTIDFSKCSAEIVKREVWVTDAQVAYQGGDYGYYFFDDEAANSKIHNAVADEVDDLYGLFKFTFDNSNAGSNLISVELTDEDLALNYAVNFSKCSGEITFREIEVPTTASFEYVKNRKQHNLVIEGLRSGESLALAIYFRNPDIGSDPYDSLWISPNGSTKTVEELLNNYQPAGYIDWDEYKSTVFQVAEITPKMLDFTNETLTKVYDQNANFSYTVSEVTDEELVVSFVAVDGDGVALKDAGEFTGVDASSVVFSINDVQTNNYAFRETEGIANVTVTPKQLNFNTLYFNYPPSYYYVTLEIRLGTAVGVYEGDVARLFATFKSTPENNSAITLDTASSVYIYAENNAKINKNYVLPEDKSTITVYTSTFDFITIDSETLKGSYTVDSDFTDCVLLVNIPTDGGYIFSSTENFMTDNLYDANGNIMKESTNTPGNYGLKAGTYYWQVSVNSTPLGTLNVEKNIPTGAKEKPHAITYNENKFIAEDAHVDWSVADEYYYKAFLIKGTYTVSQKGLKISVFDTSWNTVATLTDKFTISTINYYYVYISKGDNADVYDTITKFTLVNDLLLDGNADFLSDSMDEQGVLVSEDYDVTNGQIISFCFDPEYKVTQVYTFELLSDTKSFGNLVASYRFYDSDFREVAITWDGSNLTFPSGYTEQDALYIVVQFKAADTGVYIRAE